MTNDKVRHLEESGDWVAAAEAWKDIAETEHTAAAYVRYGWALKRAGFTDAAIEKFETAIRIDPAHVEALLSVGLAYEEQDRLSDARTALETALEIDERQVFLTILGGVLLDMGLLDEAESRLRRSVELRPDDDEALLLLGLAVKDHDRAAAVGYLQEAARIDPNHPRLHRELGYCLMMLKDYEAAEHALRVAVSMDSDDAWAFHYLGHVMTFRGNLAAAKDAFMTAAKLKPEVEFFWSTAAEALGRLGRREEADRLFLRALSADVGDPLTSLQYGIFLRDSGRPQKAVGYLERALRDPRLTKRVERVLNAIREQR